MAQIIKKPPTPSKLPTPDLAITFVVDHAKEPLAPKTETAKKYAEAKKLLEEVIAKHPKTPWADLAQDTLDRGFSGASSKEWQSTIPKYAERWQFGAGSNERRGRGQAVGKVEPSRARSLNSL